MTASDNPRAPRRQKRGDQRLKRLHDMAVGPRERSYEPAATPDSAIDLGWGRLIFADTFDSASAIAEAMRDDDSRLGRIGRAMARHPELTSGTGRLDLDVVRHVREPVAVKIGAQGLFCLAFPERGLGVALKVHSGSGDALPAATSAVLSRVMGDAWGEPEGWALRDVRNVVGRSVGAWDVELED